MERRIHNVYDYENYRLLLADDFARRVAFNNSYSLRGYANDIGVSASYLSKIFNCKINLSVEKGNKIFKSLGFISKELSYVEDLILFNTTSDVFLKRELKKKMNSNYGVTNLITRKENLPMGKSVVAFIVYALIRDLSSFEMLYSLTDQLEINREEIIRAVDLLIDEGFLKKEKDRFVVTGKDFQIMNGQDSFCEFGTTLANFFYDLYKRKGVVKVPESVASCLVLGFDDTAINEVYELQKHYILTLLKIAKRCKDPTKFVFLNNLILEKDLQRREDTVNH